MREESVQAQVVEVTMPPVTEGERSEPGVAGGIATAWRPDPQVPVRPKRRRFSGAYKARIVREAEGCREPGEIGVLLRREGLYSSQLSQWRAAMREGAVAGLGKKRGRKKDPDAELQGRVVELERENARLKRQLKQAETVIEVQKKLSEMLGIPLNSDSDDENS